MRFWLSWLIFEKIGIRKPVQKIEEETHYDQLWRRRFESIKADLENGHFVYHRRRPHCLHCGSRKLERETKQIEDRHWNLSYTNWNYTLRDCTFYTCQTCGHTQRSNGGGYIEWKKDKKNKKKP